MEKYAAECVCQVMETGHDIVIGLPTIMNYTQWCLSIFLKEKLDRNYGITDDSGEEDLVITIQLPF